MRRSIFWRLRRLIFLISTLITAASILLFLTVQVGHIPSATDFITAQTHMSAQLLLGLLFIVGIMGIAVTGPRRHNDYYDPQSYNSTWWHYGDD